jgi:hypothetical protein
MRPTRWKWLTPKERGLGVAPSGMVSAGLLPGFWFRGIGLSSVEVDRVASVKRRA